MEKSELLKQIGELAFNYERDFGGCAQCVLAAGKDTIGHVTEEVFQSAAGFAGGIGLSGHDCCALLGGVMLLGCFKGRVLTDFKDEARSNREAYRMTRLLMNKFMETYGTTNCREVQEKILGAPFDLSNKEGYKAFLAAGGHVDGCTNVCKNVAIWAAEILVDEKYIDCETV